MVPKDEVLAGKFADLWPHLNERQRRLVVGAEAKALGRGGVTAAARAAGMSRPTVRKALVELAEAPVAMGCPEESGQRVPIGFVERIEDRGN